MARLAAQEQINLGLDLQGGSHLLLEVELDAVIDERLQDLVDEVRRRLRRERIGYRGLGARRDGALHAHRAGAATRGPGSARRAQPARAGTAFGLATAREFT